MSRRSPRLSRRALGLVFGWLLLAAQQLALLHPLAHIGGALHGHAHAHGHAETAAVDAATQDCALCLASAAATPLATAAPAGGLARPRDATVAMAAAPVPPAACAPGGARNRGPPVSG